MSSCEYVFDPQEWETATAEERHIDTVWSCPRESLPEQAHCCFHAPPEACGDDEARDRLLEEITTAEYENRFIGADLGTLDLSHRLVSATNTQPIDLRHADIGTLRLRGTKTAQPLLFSGSDISTADCHNATFEAKFLLNDATVGTFSGKEATFTDKAYFNDSVIETAVFVDSTVADTISFANAELRQAVFTEASFTDAIFENATLSKVPSQSTLSFEHVHLQRGDFGATEFLDPVSFAHAQLAQVDFEVAEFYADAVFQNATFEASADFTSAVFRQADFGNTEFAGAAVFEGTVFAKAGFNESALSDVRFRDCTVESSLSFSNASIRSGQFDGITASDAIEFDGTSFTQRIGLVGVETPELVLGDTIFNRSVRFEDLELGNCYATGVLFNQNCRFEAVQIEHEATFDHSRFHGTVSIADTTFNGGASLENTVFFQSFSMQHIEAARPVTFAEAVFQRAANIQASQFSRLAFNDVVFEDIAGFADTTVTEQLSFTGTELSTGTFEGVRGYVAFSESTLDQGALTIPSGEFTFYDVSDSTIGDVKITAESDDISNVFRYFYIKNTTFDGFDFGRYKTELSGTNWQLHSTLIEEHCTVAAHEQVTHEMVADAYGLETDAVDAFDVSAAFRADTHPDAAKEGLVFASTSPTEMENTYMKAKNGASAGGDNKAAAEFFRHELKYRQRVHVRGLLDSTDRYRSRFLSGFNFVSNFIMDKVTGYGERPRNVVLTSLVTIGGFALLYRSVEALPGGSSLEYVLFSLQNFVTFIIGTRPAAALTVRYLTAIEAFLGAFLIALFVFTLTRSVNR